MSYTKNNTRQSLTRKSWWSASSCLPSSLSPFLAHTRLLSSPWLLTSFSPPPLQLPVSPHTSPNTTSLSSPLLSPQTPEQPTHCLPTHTYIHTHTSRAWFLVATALSSSLCSLSLLNTLALPTLCMLGYITEDSCSARPNYLLS